MPFYERLEKQSAKFFGLVSFGPGPVGSGDESGFISKPEFMVLHMWVAEISFYTRPRAIVTVMHTNKGIQGGYLIPLNEETKGREYGGSDPSKPVNLINWEDPVIDALQSINGAPLSAGSPDFPEYSFNLAITTFGGVSTTVSMAGPVGETSLDNLGKALSSTVRTIINIYDNKDMQKYITPDPDEWEG